MNGDAPDPGTVETDDRCPTCGAGDGEECDPDCCCVRCEQMRQRAKLLAVEALID